MEKDKKLNDEGIDPEIIETDGEENPESVLNLFSKYKMVFIIAAVAIVAIGVVWYVRYKQEQDSALASVLLSRVMPFVESAEYKKSLEGDLQTKYRGESGKGLVRIVDEFEGTDQGKLAALHAGTAYYNLNKFADAVKYFKIAEESSAKLIQVGGIAGQASCLEESGKFKEAAELYEKASTLSDEDNVKARYMTYSALCFEKISDKSNAEKYFRQVVVSYRNTEFANIAKAGLVRIGTIIE